MQYSVRVSDDEAVHHLLHLRGDPAELARARSLNETGDAALLRQLHRIPGEITAGIPIIDRDYRRVRQLCRELCLAPECADRFAIPGDRRMQRLQGDLPLQG